VLKYTQSCETCQKYKGPDHPAVGQLQPIEPPKTPFDLVGVDYLEPFPLSNDNNRYILVGIDYLTRYAETKAVCQATSSEAAAFYMEHFVLRHGSPKQLITDRGTPFLSRAFADALSRYGTKHKPTTSYHPQANGLAERFNKTITTMLSMYVNASHTNWDVLLPFVTYAYNTSCQSSHRYTPFQLVYARDAVTPVDRIFPVRLVSDLCV